MRKLRLMLLLLFCTGQLLMAQQIKVTGKVTDASTGSAVEGATVQVKGTKRNALASTSGQFTITANKGETLVISGAGYATKEVKVDGENVTITLAVLSKELQDVVVVGYGTQKRANLTSAVAVIKGDQLLKRPLAATSMSLQGFAPGVTVRQGSGQPGGDGGQINIRGIGSISASSSPLIVIDGVEGVSLDDIDPNIIESISILKDAASTAVYGVRATNGVILVKQNVGNLAKHRWPTTVSSLSKILPICPKHCRRWIIWC